MPKVRVAAGNHIVWWRRSANAQSHVNVRRVHLAQIDIRTQPEFPSNYHGTDKGSETPTAAMKSKQYPKEWPEIAKRIKDAAGWKCERCGVAHGPVPNVLTVHHLDGVKANCADWNLAALCQRCHLCIQGRVKMDQLFFTELIRVSDWFKPHFDGYLKSIKQ